MYDSNLISIRLGTGGGAPRSGAPSRCFVCGELNPRGLHLHFEAGENGVVSARWRPSGEFEGFPGVIHGGIVSTILDEAMSKAVASLGRQAYTCELRVRLRRHVESGTSFTVQGWLVEKRKRRVLAEACLATDTGEECAHAWGTFLEAPSIQSRESARLRTAQGTRI
jgi:acyl-coenzyme A thioesterase PaaI-like protein